MELMIEKTARTLLGEGPLWDYRENLLYCVDIEGHSIRKYDPATGQEWVIPTPQRVGTIGLCKDGRMLAALEDGIYFYDHSGFSLAHEPCNIEGYRFNDGKTGPDGRFYAGTMSQTGKGAFYRLDPDGTLTKLFGDVHTSNGLDWSADGTTLYYNDTDSQRTDAFAFDVASGQVGSRRTVYTYHDENPDGMCIDESGNLYVALWGSNQVRIIDPNAGQAIGEIRTPAAQTSCAVFGGSDLSTLYITSACVGRLDDPGEILAGMLLSVKMPVKGCKSNLFG